MLLPPKHQNGWDAVERSAYPSSFQRTDPMGFRRRLPATGPGGRPDRQWRMDDVMAMRLTDAGGRLAVSLDSDREMRTNHIGGLQPYWTPFGHVNGRPGGILASNARFHSDLPRAASSRAASARTASPEDRS